MRLAHSYQPGRKWVARLPYKADLLSELERFAEREEIKVGRVEVIGAVSKAAVGFYDQNKKEYFTLEFAEHLEILICVGNLSLKDGKHKAHVHISLSNREGRVFGGHLQPGTVVFAGEAVFEELIGPELHRGLDSETGLPLWKEDQ